MENRVALTPVTTEPSTPTSNAPSTAPGFSAGGVAASAPKEKSPVADGPQPGDLRLVIEQDATTGTYVYKTVDRRTGDILQQFPREDVLRFMQAEHYGPGEVFDGLT
jgi:flagellar protein FlaG